MSDSVDLSLYTNESLDRTFTLRSGTAESSVPIDLTNIQLEAEIRDQRNALVLRLTSAGDDGGIVKSDPANGVFSIHVAQGVLDYQPSRTLKYDLLLIKSGTIKRLFGGTVRVSLGTTVP